MVSKTEFLAFLEVVHAGITTSNENRISAILENYHEDEGNIELEWLGERNDPPLIAAALSPIGTRSHLRVTAPAPQWKIDQTVDDHNLLTSLKNESIDPKISMVVDVYGPPARHGAEGIEIQGANEEHLIENVISTIENREQ